MIQDCIQDFGSGVQIGQIKNIGGGGEAPDATDMYLWFMPNQSCSQW